MKRRRVPFPATASATVLALATGVALCTAAAPVQAQGHRWHGGHGGGRIGVYIGAPIVPFYYGPRHYYPPPVFYYPPPVYYYDFPPVVRVVPAPPVVYVERGDVQAPGQDYPPLQPAPLQSLPSMPPQAAAPQVQQPPVQGPQWFFCADSATYYPYVRECASPWQAVPVPAQPPVAPR